MSDCPFKEKTSNSFDGVYYNTCTLQYLGSGIHRECMGEDKCPIFTVYDNI